eukprot:TRINITY_DN3029_c0_g2_i13.p1 TRINITY_DN3029_c0_g2~~TRINITY_DN3029_c0_g2_i13.p1  ORF type:complete len:397 (-),score=57.85 TRINITY_DN3029_c0_g2_i13:12-1202(-)
MFGFGIEKFWFPDHKTVKGTYIKNFLEWQPHPTPAAWFVKSICPFWMHYLSLVGLWFVEIVVPWLMIFCMGHRSVDRVALVAVVALQVAIQLCGNFGIFNLLSAVVCLILLYPWPTWNTLLQNFMVYPVLGSVLLVQELAGVFFLLHQMEAGGVLAANWSGWIFNDSPPLLFGYKIPQMVVFIVQNLCRWHVTHGWGVFRHTYPCTSLTVEASTDGYDWKPFIFNCYHQPMWVAPLQLRLDYMMRYESGGLSFALPVVAGIVTYWEPTGERCLLVRLAKALCQGKKVVENLFKTVPFSTGVTPKFVRISSFDSKFSKMGENSANYFHNKFSEFILVVSGEGHVFYLSSHLRWSISSPIKIFIKSFFPCRILLKHKILQKKKKKNFPSSGFFFSFSL